MSYGNRRATNQNGNANTRSVSYNSGGLNERFSRITKTAAQANNGSMITPVNNNTLSNNNAKSSVFSRLRGAKQQTRSSIQHRLGKTVGSSNKKKPNEKIKVNAGKGVGKQSKSTARVTKRGAPTKTGVKKQNGGANKQAQKRKTQKKPTTEDLDKALDAYMMKDPKTAQAKLDAELTSYMDEASELLIEEGDI